MWAVATESLWVRGKKKYGLHYPETSVHCEHVACITLWTPGRLAGKYGLCYPESSGVATNELWTATRILPVPYEHVACSSLEPQHEGHRAHGM